MQNYTTKYKLEYGNSFGDSFECFIKVRGNLDIVPIQLEGTCELRYKSVSNPFEPIRGASLRINIFATTEEPLNDLSIITEFEYFAEFYRNGEHLFNGWINPDGVFQNWVKNAWQVTLTAVDGLGFLKNYEFETDNLKPQEFNYLYAILKRLNYAIPIATFDDVNINFNSSGIPTILDFTNPTRRILNEGVFINNNGRALDCETVLKDILGKYNFTIQQSTINGNLVWLIQRVPFLLYAANRRGQVWGFSEIEDGQPNWTQLNTFLKNDSFITSDSENLESDAIHCNENQQISFIPAVQNFRFEMKWLGLINQWLGILEDKTEITDSNFAFYNANGGLVSFRGTAGAPAFPVANSNPNHEVNIQTQVNLVIKIKGSLEVQSNNNVFGNIGGNYRLRIEYSPVEGGTLHLKVNSNNNTEWVDSSSIIRLYNINLEPLEIERKDFFDIDIETPPVGSGELKFIFWNPSLNLSFGSTALITSVTDSVDVFYSDPLLGKGEFHDSKRLNFASSFLQEPQKVINSNHNEGFFINNLYRITLGDKLPQNQWKSLQTPVFNDLLELSARERINMLRSPQMRFRGDIFGYIPYAALINFSGIDGTFVPVDYVYKTRDNIITLESHQIFGGTTQQEYEKSYIFDDERNVLIKS